jgi:hypothetical protein
MTFHIYFMHSNDNGLTWSPETQVTHGTTSEAYPTIARNGQQVAVVYFTFSGEADYITSSDGGATWFGPQVISPIPNKPNTIFIVTVGQTRHILWLHSRTGPPHVYYRRSKIQPSFVRASSSLRHTALQVSPNPVRGNAKLTFDNTRPLQEVRIELFDAAGRSLGSRQAGELSAGRQSIDLDLPPLPELYGAIFAGLFSGSSTIGTTQFILMK